MTQHHKEDLKRKVIRGAREYGFGSVLFRHVIGERLGVNATDMECLGILLFKGLTSPSELAHYTGLSSGATTAMLDRLEKSGLVRRQPNPHDRRGIRIEIVPEAIKKIAPLFGPARLAQSELLARYAPHELALIADYFKQSMQLWEVERLKLIKATRPQK